MFTPIHTSLGALLLFEGSSGLLFHNGAVFGISSLISGSVFSPSHDNVPIVAGLISSVLPVYLLAPSLIPSYPAPPNSLASAMTTLGVGFLLGWGTKVSHLKRRTLMNSKLIIVLGTRMAAAALPDICSVGYHVSRHAH